jgi:copper ion binding protein
MRVTLDVKGMTCGHCVARVERALRALSGVEKVEVSLDEHRATVEGADGVATDALVAAVKEAGYDASL